MFIFLYFRIYLGEVSIGSLNSWVLMFMDRCENIIVGRLDFELRVGFLNCL